MKRNQLDVENFVAEITMYESPTVIVEAPPDVQFYYLFFSPNVRVLSPDPKYVNRKAAIIKLVKKIGDPSVIGILDADFCRIKGFQGMKDTQYLFFTDYHDRDVNLFFSEGLKKFINKNILPSNSVDSICLACANIAVELGYYFLALAKNGAYEVLFILYQDMTDFIDKDLKVSYEKIHKLLPKRLKKKIIAEVNKIRNDPTIDLYQVVKGHHFFLVLAYLIWIGIFPCKFNLADAYENPEHFASIIEDVVRDYYDIADFKQTQLYHDILEHQSSCDIKFLK